MTNPLITPSMAEDYRMWMRNADTPEERERLMAWIVALVNEKARQEGDEERQARTRSAPVEPDYHGS